jgi:hypothetical protein
VGAWARGDVTPAQPQRERLRDVLGIGVEAWDVKVGAASSAGAASAAPVAEDDGAALPATAEGLDGLIEQVRRARSVPDVAPTVLARLAAVETRAVLAREQLCDIAEPAWHHPAWAATLERCVDALQGDPLARETLLGALDPQQLPTPSIREEFPVEAAAADAANAVLVAARRRKYGNPHA